MIAAPAWAANVHKPASHPVHHAGRAAHRSAVKYTRARRGARYSKNTQRLRYARYRRYRRYWRRRPRGQQAIRPQRVTQIQDALIRAGYLADPADGDWDAATIAAMQKYQADHGWQTRITPDARALESLGLGPNYSGALNAEDARSFDAPLPGPGVSPAEAAGFAAASGIAQ